MAEAYRSYVFPYMCTSSSSYPLLAATIQATSYPQHPPVVPTPGPVNLELPIMTLTLSVNVAYIFDEEVIPNVRPRTICELHRASKMILPETTSRMGGKEVVIKKPVFRTDLVGTTEDLDCFWGLCSLILDVGTEYRATSFCTSEFGVSPDMEAVRILARLAKDVLPFREIYEQHSKSPLAAFMAGQIDHENPEKEEPWDYTSSGISVSQRASYFARMLSDYGRDDAKDIVAVCRNVAADVVLKLPTCGMQPLGLDDERYALPNEKASFANRVLTVLSPDSSDYDKSDKNTMAHRLALLYQSPTVLAVTKAMTLKVGHRQMAHGLRHAHDGFDFPAAAFAFAATLIQTQLKVMRDLPLTNNQDLGNYADRGVIMEEEALRWGANARQIVDLIMPTSISKKSVLLQDGIALVAMAKAMESSLVLAGVALPLGESDRIMKKLLALRDA
uniref:Uncharacterized protein n=1 Tax=Hypholoma sublateritium (strain FD-334 SS-4) TaxID=945553 RepID=A0A0D2L9B3_HYPSF